MNLRNVISFTCCGLTAASIVLATATSGEASLINRGPATNISGNSDVSTTGTLIGALNVGGPGTATTTINGVQFNGLNIGGSTSITSGNFTFSDTVPFLSTVASPSNPPFSNLSASYQTMLSTLAGNGGATPFTLTMSGLTAGAAYQFQWWTDNSNSGFNFTTATAGNSVALNSNTLGDTGGVGQFAIGSFLADGTGFQSITFSGPSNSAINGIQLRQAGPAPAVAVVPETDPIIGALLLLGICSFGVTKRVVSAWRKTSVA